MELMNPGAGNAAHMLCTMLDATDAVTLQTPGHRAMLIGRHEATDDGRVSLVLPVDDDLTRRLLHDGQQLAMIEVIEVGATVTGLLTPTGEGDETDIVAMLVPTSVELSLAV